MPRYRCGQCRGEFVAQRPSCAKCGLDPSQDKRHAALFQEMTTIHYDPPSHVPGMGLGHAACNQKLKTGSNGDAWTGEKPVVNCEQCKASDLFLATSPPPVPADFIRTMSLASVAEKAAEAKVAAKVAASEAAAVASVE